MRKILMIIMMLTIGMSSCAIIINPNRCAPKRDKGVHGSRYYKKHGWGKGYMRWMRMQGNPQSRKDHKP